MPENKNGTTEAIRERTVSDLKKKLALFKKCAVVRCTGFGKTVMLARLTVDYDRVLFLYPADIVKETAGKVIENLTGEYHSGQEEGDVANVKFMSYMKLIRLSEEEICDLGRKYDLIIMDECHKIGAEKTADAVRTLFSSCDGHIVGATATPDRGDAFDVIDEFFGGICVDEYTVHDAFTDGLIQRPVYTFMSYDIETDLKEEALTAGEDFDDLRVTEVYKQEFFNMKTIFNVPAVIRSVTEKYLSEYRYMKYIVFFPDFEQLHKRKKEVEGWFRTSFPDHTVDTLIITSESKETSENLKALGRLVRKDMHIDLILVVDMLNLGYHVNDLTGIIMYRCTSSSIIFAQQLGRVFSSGSSRQCLVFDIVDNLHRKSVFTLSEKGKRRERQDSAIDIVRSTDISCISDDEKLSLMEKIASSQSQHNRAAWEIVYAVKHPLSEEEKEKSMKMASDFIEAIHYADTHAYWWLQSSVVSADDVVMAEIDGKPYEATYRELIAKVVATSYMIRAKRAREEHEKRWKALNAEPYPSTRQSMKENIDTIPPLEPYAKWQNVTIRQILDTQFKDIA